MGPRRGPAPTPKNIRIGLVRGELFIDRNQNPDARTAPAEPMWWDNPGDNREPARTQVRVPPTRPAARPQD